MGLAREEGIASVFDGPMHVVILGAGASIASTCHTPEPSGKKLPSMGDLVDILDLSQLVHSRPAEDFEVAYSRLHDEDPGSRVLEEVDARVRGYFSALALPEAPSIYDYLLMALRPKDLIATFNWDPFLWQAFNRNVHVGGTPNMAFLHGSVSLGYCPSLSKAGPAGAYADPEGAHRFTPTRLLYPVAHKDYSSDEFIKREWDRLSWWLGHARRVTIFGYRAPSSDVDAMDLMSGAWGDPGLRNLEQVEIINVESESVVTKRWKNLIHTHHYDYCTDYFQSSLAQFPRRTGESFMRQYFPTTVEEAFQEPNPIPARFGSMEAFWEWHQPLLAAEARHETEQAPGSQSAPPAESPPLR